MSVTQIWSGRAAVVVAVSVVALAAVVAGWLTCAGDGPGGDTAPEPLAVAGATPAASPADPGARPASSRAAPNRRARVAAGVGPTVPAGAAPQGRCTVRVRITSATTGEPVEGAWVMVEDADDLWPEAFADARGTATFDRVTEGDGVVVVRIQGFLRASQPVAARPDTPAQVDVALVPGGVVEVRVLDAATNAPVAGADVRVESATGFAVDYVATGGDGAAIALVSPDAAMSVRVEADGYLPAAEPVWSGSAGVTPVVLTMRLARTARLEGTVRTPDGAPPRGAARIRLRRDGAAADEQETESDAEGEYEMLRLHPGRTYRAIASADGWGESEPVRVSPSADGRAVRADLVLRPATTVVVRIVDDDGAPIGGTTVVVESRDATASSGTESSAVRSVSVGPGPCVVRATAAARLAATASRDLAAGETWDVTLVLSRGAEISGTVTDAEGVPIQDASFDWDREDGDPIDARSTDATGRFTLRGLRPGPRSLTVRRLPEFETLVLDAVPAPSSGVRIALRRRGRLRMRIARPDGPQPVEADLFGLRDGRTPHVFEHQIPADGVLDLPWPPDADSVVVAAAGCAPVTRSVSVPLESVVDLGTISVSRGAAVAGRLAFPAGHAAKYVRICVRRSGAREPFVTTATAEDGTFHLHGLLPGTVVIEAQPDDWPHATYEVMSGAERPVELVLPAVGVLWVRVTAPDGDPQPGVHVVALDAEGHPLRADWARETTDDAGVAMLRLPVGLAHVEVSGRVRASSVVRAEDIVVLTVRVP